MSDSEEMAGHWLSVEPVVDAVVANCTSRFFNCVCKNVLAPSLMGKVTKADWNFAT
jgi:hypothetical protein